MLKHGSTQSKALKDLWIPRSLVGYSPSVELGVDTELADRDIGAIERARDGGVPVTTLARLTREALVCGRCDAGG